MVFYPFQLKLDDITFVLGETYWKDFYGNIKEELTHGIPDTLGKSAHTTLFVDSNHSANVVTWN